MGMVLKKEEATRVAQSRVAPPPTCVSFFPLYRAGVRMQGEFDSY